MKPSETAVVLAKIAAFDRRTVGQTDVAAWHDVIGDLEQSDVLDAVSAHYRESSDWIMPAEVRQRVAEMLRRRSSGQWAPGQYGVPRDHAHPTLTMRERMGFFDLPREVRELLEQMPRGNPIALHPRRAAWEREHRQWRRSAAAEPNPHYDPEPFCPSCQIRHGLPIHYD